MNGLVALSFEQPLYRDLVLISPRDRPLSSGARSLMVHVKEGITARKIAG